jgi:hypothetical protein
MIESLLEPNKLMHLVGVTYPFTAVRYGSRIDDSAVLIEPSLPPLLSCVVLLSLFSIVSPEAFFIGVERYDVRVVDARNDVIITN